MIQLFINCMSRFSHNRFIAFFMTIAHLNEFAQKLVLWKASWSVALYQMRRNSKDDDDLGRMTEKFLALSNFKSHLVSSHFQKIHNLTLAPWVNDTVFDKLMFLINYQFTRFFETPELQRLTGGMFWSVIYS